MKTAAEEWVRAARDDVETVKKILDDLRLTHIAAYHVQQCVEKSFKAVLEHHKQSVPNIHNLITLHGRVEAHLPMDTDVVDLDMLDRLNQLYIEARYPGEQGLLPEGKPSVEEARRFFHFADAVLDMVEQHLSERE